MGPKAGGDKPRRAHVGPEFVDDLRAEITPEQRTLLARLWNPSEPFGTTPAKLLFHRLSATRSRQALAKLGGNVVTEMRGGPDESYTLQLLGALLSDRGPEFESLLARYLAYIVKRYDADPAIKQVTREEVERDLGLTGLALRDLPHLVNLGSFCSGSTTSPTSWTLGMPRDIHDLAEVQDWSRFIRERALRGYDPQMPVPANARLEYRARVQQAAQYGRKRDAKASLSPTPQRARRRATEPLGVRWITPFSPTSGPDWTCPTCKLGSLTLVANSLMSYETRRSRDARKNDEAWTPEHTEERAHLALRCARPGCGEYVIVTGFLSSKQVDGFETYEDEFRPLFVQPSPELVDLPPNCPSTIAAQLRRAFTLFWLDPSAAANRVRASVECLMDHQRVARGLSLHRRIERFQAAQPNLGHALMAVKWIGNDGSHRRELARGHLLKAFEMLSHVLEELYGQREQRQKRVAKMAGRINQRHAKKGRRQATDK